MKTSKNKKKLLETVDTMKVYEVSDAIKMLKDNSFTKFDETLDIAIRLGIDTSKTDQNIKGVINLPNGTGKKIKVAVICSDELQEEAKKNGADIVGESELIENINNGQIDFDLLIATPDVMPKLGKVAKILGPKGLMPNPKLGTVSKDVALAVKNAKFGQVKFKNDKSGIVHAGLGKLSFTDEDLLSNIKSFYQSVVKSKPETVKGSFIKKVTIASTMGVGLEVNQLNLR